MIKMVSAIIKLFFVLFDKTSLWINPQVIHKHQTFILKSIFFVLQLF